MVTAEFAVAVPAILLVLAVVLAAVDLGIDQVRCIDAARSAARSLARGDSSGAALRQARELAPERSVISVSTGGAVVSVEVRGQPNALLDLIGLHLTPRGVALAASEAAEVLP